MSINRTPSTGRKSSLSTFSMYSKLALALGTLSYAVFNLVSLWSLHKNPSVNLMVPENFTAEQATTQLKALSHEQLLKLQFEQKHILATNPTDELVIKNLAALAELLGDKSSQTSLTLIAANRSLRDFPAQAAAIQILLAEKNYEKALFHIDGLIRSDPGHQKLMLELLVSFAENREALEPLAKLLKKSPPWRETFIHYLEENSKQTQTSYGLLSAMRKAGATVQSAEIIPQIAKLVAEKSFDRANYIWLDFLSDAELRKVALLFDGNFDLDIGNRYFDWTYQSLPNVDLRLVAKSSGSVDRILRVNFSSGKTAFNNFFQYLRLQPGNYVLRGEEKTDGLKTDVGLVWRVTCVSQEPQIIGASEPLIEATSWRNFETNFSVPAFGCDTQELRLSNNARSYLDQQISGLAYFDSLSVQLAGSVNTAP
jgi:hypothetical protein